MGQKIGQEKIDREDGYLYYLGKDGHVWKSPMKSNSRGRKARIGEEKIQREQGYLYYIDKNGYVARAVMKNSSKKRR